MPRQPAKPDRKFDDIIQAGEKAHVMVLAHRAAVEPRLPAGLIDGLRADLDGLSDKRTAVTTAKVKAKAATATQNAALVQAHAVISGIRIAIQKTDAGADVRRGYGLGSRLDGRNVTSVVTAGKAIIDRATEEPTEARALGILDSDVALLKDLVAAVTKSDAAQEGLIAARPMTTGERNRAAKRIVSAVRRIAGAGTLAFASNPELRKQFDALDDAPKRKKKVA